MRQVTNTLPTEPEQSSFDSLRLSTYFKTSPVASMLGPASFQPVLQMPQYGRRHHDPTHFAVIQQEQQQHYIPQRFVPQAAQHQLRNRPPPPRMQTQPPFARMDPYTYGMNQPGYSSVSLSFPLQHLPTGYNAPSGYADMGKIQYGRVARTLADIILPAQHAQSTSELVAIPSFPRGPPRKPKQSGHALWIGNLPPAATVTDLKDHFSIDATSDIQSLFLISKSNCAFVNYRSESACAAAMNRFHGSRFHGVRLVCRPRRASTTKSNASTITESHKPAVNPKSAPKGLNHDAAKDEPPYPTIVDSGPAAPGATDTQTTSSTTAATKALEVFFIVKSLTLQDLEASVLNGVWATQSHNEPRLNQAFNTADNVYLIFSANKSGEYFGYARMVSSIAGEAVPVGSAPNFRTPTPSDSPRSILTPATETAPRGRIVDDSARGTIFWEAELPDEESASSNKVLEEGNGGQDLGRPFQIEWISTARLPFYRTRGLRNPWNGNKEVKIARDGTELEPSIGKRLVQMFLFPA
jgi:hypothetical protein